MGIIDALKPIHQGIYFALWSLAQTLWDFDRILLTVALWINSFRAFLIGHAAQIVELVAEGLASPAGLFLALAFVLYGLWRLAAIFFPNMSWQPVELPRVVVYGLLIGAFFAGPAVATVALEELRIDLAENIRGGVTGRLAPTFTPAGYSSSEPGLTVYDIDGSGSASGINLAASLMGVQNVSDLGSPELPPAFQASYFTYGTPADFTLDDEDARTEALSQAGEGVLVLFLAPLAIGYAICEALLWLVLTVAALILWIGLPIALMLAPFRISEGLFSTFFNRYASLWIETVISAAIMGLFTGVLANAAAQGLGLFLAAGLLATLVVVWRILSAARLASAAVGTVGGAQVTGGVSATQAAGTMAAGATAVVGGLVTGGLTTAAVMAGGALVAGSGVSGRSAEESSGPGSQAAALGGFLVGKSVRARRALQAFQEARLVSGLHNAEQPDAIDAAYIGSLLSSRGTSSAYLTLGMMGGPQQTYRNLGLAPRSSDNGWGVDEEGNNPADWDASRGSRPAGRGPGPAAPGPDGPGAPNEGSGPSPSPGGRGRRTDPAVDGRARGRRQGSQDAAGQLDGGPEPRPVELPPGAGGRAARSEAVPAADLQQALDEAARQMAGLSTQLSQSPLAFTGRPEGVQAWLDALTKPEGPDSVRDDLITQAERQAGPAAGQVAAAAAKHGAQAVQEAVLAVAAQVQAYETAGLSQAQVLQRFQDGKAFQDLASGLAPNSPFRPDQAGFDDLAAIADLTLAARRQISRQAVIAALGLAIDEQADDPVTAAAARLSIPVNQSPQAERGSQADRGSQLYLGPYAGVSRLLAARARQMGLSGRGLVAAEALLNQGDAPAAFRLIRSAPRATDATARQLLADLEVLPAEGLDIAQSARPAEPPEGESPVIEDLDQEKRS